MIIYGASNCHDGIGKPKIVCYDDIERFIEGNYKTLIEFLEEYANECLHLYLIDLDTCEIVEEKHLTITELEKYL